MADNTILNAGTGGDTYASDDVTTLNGGVSAGIKVQRVKLMWGSDGTATDAALVAGSGIPIQGSQNDGVTYDSANAPVLSAGTTLAGAIKRFTLTGTGAQTLGAYDSGVAAYRDLKCNAVGHLYTIGGNDVGATASTQGTMVLCSDGSVNTRLRSDTSGRLMSVGAAAAGAAIVGNPVLMGGSDGTNARALLVNTLGQLSVITNSLTDNAAFTDGVSPVAVAGYIYDEVAGTALTENDAAAARINVNRAQVHVFEDGATRGRYATITAASTAAVAADPALVVALSPNNFKAASTAPVASDPALVVAISPNTGTLKVNTDPTRVISYRGRVCTFRTAGRAGTAGQKIFSIHNATGSSVIVDVKRIKVDLVSTAVRAITVQPSLIRLWKVTVLPTNGTALTKVSKDSVLYPTSSASVTILGDASADGTGSATTLTATLPAGTMFSQEFGSRNFTAAGQEAADKITFLDTEEDVMTLRPLEGVVVFLDYTTATFNPVTDFWTATCDWDEYTAT